jgi:hypothetical protein
MEEQKEARYRLGIQVGIALAILTAIEFWVASVASGPVPYPVLCAPLAPITWISLWAARSPGLFIGVGILLKAGLILNYYMHLDHVLGTAH